MSDDITIRAVRPGDGPAVAAVFGAARALMTYLPALHTEAEDVAYFSGVVSGHDGAARVVEVAVLGGAGSNKGPVVGFSAVRDDWLDHLYVTPAHQGHGIGSALLAWAQGTRPAGLHLWVFEPNTGAQALYQRAGFVMAERTDGAGNEERVPDLRLRWPGRGQ